MRKISFTIALVLLTSVGVSAQEKGAYLTFGGGVGLSAFNYELDGYPGLQKDGKNVYQLGGNASIGFNYYFTKHWGLGTGIGMSYYRSKGKYNTSFDKDTYMSLGTYTDDDEGNPDREFDLRVRLQDWEELQTGYFFEIPLMLMYQNRFGKQKKTGMYFGIGAKLQLPIQGRYKAVDGKYAKDLRLSVSGAYNDGVPEFFGEAASDPSLSQHGFGAINDPNKRYDWNGDLSLKPSWAGTVELGLLFALNKRWDFTIGGYFDYGFNNIKKGEDKEFMAGPEANYHETANGNVADGIAYNGMINSNVTDKVNLISGGIKVGFRVKFGKIVEEPEEVPVVINVCDTLRDTVIIIERTIVEPQIVQPKPEERFTPEERELLKARIFFDLNKSFLRQASKETLDRVVVFMNKYPDVRLRVLGNTCVLGGDKINISLGLRRAESAKKYLVEKGISASRIVTATVSSYDPLMPNEYEMDRQLNRRCEFEVDYQNSGR